MKIEQWRCEETFAGRCVSTTVWSNGETAKERKATGNSNMNNII